MMLHFFAEISDPIKQPGALLLFVSVVRPEAIVGSGCFLSPFLPCRASQPGQEDGGGCRHDHWLID